MVKESFGCCGLEIKLPAKEYQKWQDKGWLGKNGVCEFPRSVQAFPMEARLNGLPPEFWDKATEDCIQKAIKAGHILFVDGNAVAMTKAQYLAKYPEFPDPELVLRLKGKLPPAKKEPAKKKFIKIGRC